MQPFAIFKPGSHFDSRGVEISFTNGDLNAIAEFYDPAAHEAPIVIGHPKADAPAYGWVKELAFSDGVLEATPDQVDSSFSDLVAAGRFKKVSASFYLPDAAANPKPGAYYLRHVGFLGAQPPAVKGLKAVEFADDEDGVITIEFADNGAADGSMVARILRRLRDWIIEKDGVEAADRAISSYDVDFIQDDATRAHAAANASTAFAEPTTPVTSQEDDSMKPEEIAAKEAEIKAGEEKLAQEKADFAESQKADKKRTAEVTKRESAVAFAEAAAEVERFVDDGRVPPAFRDRLAALLASLGADDDVEFSEGEGDKAETKTASAKAILMGFLDALPKQIEFTEKSAEDGDELDGADPQAVANQAIAFQEEQRGKGIKVSTQAAVRHVLKGAAA